MKIILKNKNIISQINNLKKKFSSGIKNAMVDVGNELTKESKRLIVSPPKTGIVYLVRNNKTGKQFHHQASATGEAPANMYGNLKESIRYKAGGNSNKIEITAGNYKVNYAQTLELGNEYLKIGKRPYLSKSIQNKSSYILERFKICIDKEILKK